jgi:hypothetical protein
MAKAMIETIHYFVITEKPKYLKHIRIVVFDANIITSFVHALQRFVVAPESTPGLPTVLEGTCMQIIAKECNDVMFTLFAFSGSVWCTTRTTQSAGAPEANRPMSPGRRPEKACTLAVFAATSQDMKAAIQGIDNLANEECSEKVIDSALVRSGVEGDRKNVVRSALSWVDIDFDN